MEETVFPFQVKNSSSILRTAPAILAVIALLVFAACRDDDRGTQRMVERLQDLNEHIDPVENGYENDLRVAYLRRMAVPVDPAQRLRYNGTVAQELLLAGETTEAISLLEGIDSVFNSKFELAEPAFVYEIYRMLGISYLRLGEQQNCQFNHTSYSCILPIQRDAIHQLKQGSSKAIGIYSLILEQNPQDLETRWLLNVAYMTLGRYPNDVPEKWVIPASAFESDYDIGRFLDIAPQVGLDATTMSGSSVVEDFDGDGDLDVMVSSSGADDPLRYFEQTIDSAFVDRSKEAGLEGLVGGLNLVPADYDNDGNVDVLVLRGGWLGKAGEYPNSLLRNNGDHTFSDVTEVAGLLSFHPTQSAAWGDYNNDGWLDLVIANESTSEVPHPCSLFENKGNGTFEEVASKKGVALVGYFKGVVWGDINNDGFPDLYFSDLLGDNHLFLNAPSQDSAMREFTDITEKAGVTAPHKSFPLWFWDYDNDGWEDLLVLTYNGSTSDVAADYLGEPHDMEMSCLYHNNGDGTFTDVSKAAGIDFPLTAMGCNFGDLDNDGFLDFYVGTGEPDMKAIVPNRMYRNDRGLYFQDVTTSGGFGHLQKGHGVSFADLDQDGDQDVFVVLGGAYSGDRYQNVLFQNPGHDNNWVSLTFEGSISNRSAIGVRIKLTVTNEDTERSIQRTVSSGGSFGANPLRQEIGLGKVDKIDRIEIYWPTSGIEQTFENVLPDRYYVIREREKRLQEVVLPVIDWIMSSAPKPHHMNHS